MPQSYIPPAEAHSDAKSITTLLSEPFDQREVKFKPQAVKGNRALALAYVSLLLAAGAGIGWTHARSETQRVSDQLSASYVRSVDPYLAVR